MGIRFILSVWICKLTRVLLRILKRGGTALPGKAALFICPKALAKLSEGVETIIVTGTNGKTTTCSLIAGSFEAKGMRVLANRAGANLLSGITAEFAARANLLGKSKYTHAVIECDEAALKLVAPLLRPKVIVVTNLFRDQLDRYGEVMHTLGAIRAGVQEAPGAILCLNADCSLTSSIAGERDGEVLYFGMDTALPGVGEAASSDAPRCIVCGAEYEYEYRTFGHLGGFFCPSCGYRRHAADVSVSTVQRLGSDGSEAQFTVRGENHDLKLALPGSYNLYNAASALTALMAVGFDLEAAAESMTEAKGSFGRMERFVLGDVEIRMILIKNPAGCDRVIEYLASVEGDFLPVLCLNDRIADGVDVSWIWDVDFERFVGEREYSQFVISGDRAEDMRLRLKYAGAREERIRLERDTAELVRIIQDSKVPVYIMPNYTSMLALRQALSRVCGTGEFWEAS